MFCDEALEAVERIAAGDVTPDGRVADHLTTCPDCAAALDSAKKLERMLRQRPVPRAPAQFTTSTLGKVRRARWQSDQWLDAGFNLAVLSAFLLPQLSRRCLHRRSMSCACGDHRSSERDRRRNPARYGRLAFRA